MEKQKQNKTKQTNNDNNKNRIAEIILKENKVGELTLLNFKTFCKATVINTVCYGQKNAHRPME